MNFTIGKYDISMDFRSKQPWTHFKTRKLRDTETWGLVWGRFSLWIEDWTAEVYATCAECGSTEVGGVSAGDESWTVCEACCSVEQGIKYVNKREFEKI